MCTGVFSQIGDITPTRTGAASRNAARHADDKNTSIENRDGVLSSATTINELPSIPVPEIDLAPLANAMHTWTATTGHTMEGKLVDVDSFGSKVTLQRADGRKGMVELKKLIGEDRQYVLDNKHFLEPPEALGTFFWNCPARNQRSWWNTRTLIRWGDNYMQVIEVSVGHSTHPDFKTTYLLKRHFDEWKLPEPGDIAPFHVDDDYIVSDSMTFARSQAEARQMADAGTNGGTED